ncbi:MAG: tRNA (adenosine(37)-N6)-dimethylallyltransferase MiaA [Lachnospiraceae bacterium]
MKKPLIILTGPTAVGKTDLSIDLAKAVNGEIVSADSMQVYKYMDIGSAKIKPEEMKGIRHHLVDAIEPDEDFNVVRFQKMAKAALDEIYKNGKIPIVTGGTGFYIQALLYDIDFEDTKEDTSYRNSLEALAEEKGCEYVHKMLEEVDKKAAMEIHPNNTKRVIRALEYFKETGRPISEHNEEQRRKDSPYQFVYFVLNRARATLYDRINLRIDQMLEAGLLDEVKSLAEKGYTKDMVSMQGLGYKEILAYLDGEMTMEEAIYILKRDTRHFAKRQLTWFKREKDVTWIDLDTFQSRQQVRNEMIQICKKKEILKN